MQFVGQKRCIYSGKNGGRRTNTPMRIELNLAAATAAIGLAMLTGQRAANATSYTITVDASKQTAAAIRASGRPASARARPA